MIWQDAADEHGLQCRDDSFGDVRAATPAYDSDRATKENAAALDAFTKKGRLSVGGPFFSCQWSTIVEHGLRTSSLRREDGLDRLELIIEGRGPPPFTQRVIRVHCRVDLSCHYDVKLAD
jgi:hypothetical protein